MTHLRSIKESDAQFIWHWIHEVKHPEWKQWDGPYFHEEEVHRSLIEFCEHEFPRFLTADKRMITHNDEAVGIVSRFEEEPEGGGWYELGILIFDPEYWNRGIGQDALRLWVDDTFAHTNAHVITITTWSGNQRMIASALRAGFKECARIPEARLWDKRRWDSIKLAILRTN